jgi:hypothetical protein
MSSSGSRGRDDEAKPLKRAPKSSNPISLNPTDRLAAMTRERIDALERDKQELKAEVARLVPCVAENTRLEEALSNAEFNGVFATIAIGVGGFLVSYATFTRKAATAWANVAAGCLLDGDRSVTRPIRPAASTTLNPTRGCPSVQFRLKSP